MIRKSKNNDIKIELDECELKQIEIKYGNIEMFTRTLYSGHKILSYHFIERKHIRPTEQEKIRFSGIPVVTELYQHFDEPKKERKRCR